MDFKLKTNPNPNDYGKKAQIVDLGNGSNVVYVPKFLAYDVSWEFFSYLDNHIPWTIPTIHVFGRSCMQPRDTCYVASAGLPNLIYSGYQPRAYSWDEFPPLKDILDAVHKILPGSMFNSLLLNRYKGGNDYIGWHSDDEKLYGAIFHFFPFQAFFNPAVYPNLSSSLPNPKPICFTTIFMLSLI
ncbi:DNA oxidative demethylase ALKBH2-like [Hibiscus syriacus]|uniref:DNA oxidative demethylase ALKBH2-like n=1 Tax=Hibiscus syriacus TaxID=106335 RepID=UPI001922900C|nr:DNA oxidative demethylase ALKBH2-like [Hibiscus syriacus]